jgi:hypothetical protein
MRSRKLSFTYIFLIVFLLLFIILISTPNTSAQDAPIVVSTVPVPLENFVSLDQEIIVFFNENMTEQATKSAFSISPPVENYEFEWHITGLRFVPKDEDAKLEPKEVYTVTISTKARNEAGINLTEDYSWTFTTEEKKESGGSGDDEGFLDWNVWEPIVTGLTVLGTVIFALYGVWRYRKRRLKLKDHITRLDEIYDKYRKDPYVCEHKLNQLKESLKIKFKSGEMEENHYLIMDKKIDDYLSNVRYRKTLTKPKIIGGPEGEIREELEKQLIVGEPDIDNEFNEPVRQKPHSNRESHREIRRKPMDDLENEDLSEKPSKSKKPPRPKIIPD